MWPWCPWKKKSVGQMALSGQMMKFPPTCHIWLWLSPEHFLSLCNKKNRDIIVHWYSALIYRDMTIGPYRPALRQSTVLRSFTWAWNYLLNTIGIKGWNTNLISQPFQAVLQEADSFFNILYSTFEAMIAPAPSSSISSPGSFNAPQIASRLCTEISLLLISVAGMG